MAHLRCPVNIHDIDITTMELGDSVRVIYHTDEIEPPYSDLTRARLEIDESGLVASFNIPAEFGIRTNHDVEVTADVFYVGYPNYRDRDLSRVLIRTIVVRKLRPHQ